MRSTHAKSVLLFLLATVLLVAAGCQDKYTAGYNNGYAEGYDQGRAEGKEAGSRATAAEYEVWGGFVGLVVGSVLGALVGAFVVVLLTRDFIRSQHQKWRRRRRVERLFRGCGVDLDDDLLDRVVAIGIKKREIEEDISQQDGPLFQMLHEQVASRLRDMDRAVLDLAGLLQRLRALQKRVPYDEKQSETKIEKLKQDLAAAEDESQKTEIRELVELEERFERNASRTQTNINRCEAKLATHLSFLDNLAMTVGNCHTLEQHQAFERVESQMTAEVEALADAFDRAMSELAGVSADDDARGEQGAD